MTGYSTRGTRDRWRVRVVPDRNEPTPARVGGLRLTVDGQPDYPGVTLADPPPHLATFAEADWPGSDRLTRCRFWEQACGTWWRRHGWPGGIRGLAALVGATRRESLG